jgi:predicted house-cleaning noncanonical NTP pyrophosphatase (MazG superfamily)
MELLNLPQFQDLISSINTTTITPDKIVEILDYLFSYYNKTNIDKILSILKKVKSICDAHGYDKNLITHTLNTTQVLGDENLTEALINYLSDGDESKIADKLNSISTVESYDNELENFSDEEILMDITNFSNISHTEQLISRSPIEWNSDHSQGFIPDYESFWYFIDVTPPMDKYSGVLVTIYRFKNNIPYRFGGLNKENIETLLNKKSLYIVETCKDKGHAEIFVNKVHKSILGD